jgi:hypothetical protein
MTYVYILAAILLRLLPHPWNMTPMGAMFLFSGATFRSRKLSIVVPLAALLVSDYLVVSFLYHGFYSWMMTSSWPAFVVVALIGWWLRAQMTWTRVLGASLAASVAFFTVSNLMVWMTGVLYPVTAIGLITCFVKAIPFFHNTIFGDLFYSAMFFGSYELIRRHRHSISSTTQQ